MIEALKRRGRAATRAPASTCGEFHDTLHLRRHHAGQLRPSPVRAQRPMRRRRAARRVGGPAPRARCASETDAHAIGPACPTEAPTLGLRPGHARRRRQRATVTVSGAVEGEFAIELLPRSGAARDRELRVARALRLLRRHQVPPRPRRLRHPGRRPEHHATTTATSRASAPAVPATSSRSSHRPPSELDYDPYTVAMANDTVTNGSQFFVTLADLDEALRWVGSYSIFGQVSEGTDVVDAIAAVPVNDPEIGVRRPGDHRVASRIGRPDSEASTSRRSRARPSKPLCFVKESQPPKPLSKANRRSILTVLFAQRFTTGRKAMGRLGLG